MIGKWAKEFRLEIVKHEDRPDQLQGATVFRIVDIFTTRDGQWGDDHVNESIPGGIEQWARNKYLRSPTNSEHIQGGGGETHLFAILLDQNGKRMANHQVIFWSDGLQRLADPQYDGYARRVTANGSGAVDNPISKGSTFDPNNKQGSWCWCPAGVAADVVKGGGLPFQWHVSTFAVWQAELALVGNPPISETLNTLRDFAWSTVANHFNEATRFSNYAQQHNLGVGLTKQLEFGAFHLQGFLKGVAYTRKDGSTSIQHILWLT